jgi:hypothetical protein
VERPEDHAEFDVWEGTAQSGISEDKPLRPLVAPLFLIVRFLFPSGVLPEAQNLVI